MQILLFDALFFLDRSPSLVAILFLYKPAKLKPGRLLYFTCAFYMWNSGILIIFTLFLRELLFLLYEELD